jgi:hypothetical protein
MIAAMHNRIGIKCSQRAVAAWWWIIGSSRQTIQTINGKIKGANKIDR